MDPRTISYRYVQKTPSNTNTWWRKFTGLIFFIHSSHYPTLDLTESNVSEIKTRLSYLWERRVEDKANIIPSPILLLSLHLFKCEKPHFCMCRVPISNTGVTHSFLCSLSWSSTPRQWDTSLAACSSTMPRCIQHTEGPVPLSFEPQPHCRPPGACQARETTVGVISEHTSSQREEALSHKAGDLF